MITFHPRPGVAYGSVVLEAPAGPDTLLSVSRCAVVAPLQPWWTCVACRPGAMPWAETSSVMEPPAAVTATAPLPAPLSGKTDRAGAGGAAGGGWAAGGAGAAGGAAGGAAVAATGGAAGGGAVASTEAVG